ncbi:MAG: radical SAM protein [Myxococcota bacterium]
MAQGLERANLVRTGYSCNSACRFCSQTELRAREGDRPATDVRGDVVEAAKRAAAGSGVVVLSGGEVTLRRELVDWVALAREHGARRVVVQTNGRMLAYRKLVKALVRAGADVFAFALHGHVPDLHDFLTRSPGSFEQALHGAQHVQRAGARILVNTVVTRPNFRHLPDISRLLPQLGASGIRFIWPRPDGEARVQAPGLIPDPTLVAPYLHGAVGIARALNCRVSTELPADFPASETPHGDVPAQAS